MTKRANVYRRTYLGIVLGHLFVWIILIAAFSFGWVLHPDRSLNDLGTLVLSFVVYYGLDTIRDILEERRIRKTLVITKVEQMPDGTWLASSSAQGFHMSVTGESFREAALTLNYKLKALRPSDNS